MPINAPVIVSVVEVGSPVAYLRVTWDHDITGSPTTDGYLIEWDYNNPAWNPSWIVPPAVDLGLLDGNGATPVRRYTVLINLSNAFVSDWETFEEYVEGDHSVLAYGGSKWAGPAVAIETYIGYKGFGDDFESYAVGLHSELGAGKGWAAPAEAIGMGDFEIVKRTISSVDDQRVVVDNSKSPWVRTMAIGDDWTEIMVGMRIGSLRKSNWTSAPSVYLGLCNGSDSPPAVFGTRHFLGYKSRGNWVYSSSFNGYVQINSSGTNSALCLIQNGVESFGVVNMGILWLRANETLNNTCLLFTVKKGNPWTFSIVRSNNGGNLSHSSNDFVMAMNGTYPGANTSVASTDFTPDEVTYGALDTICFSFLGSTDGFEVSDIAYARLS